MDDKTKPLSATFLCYHFHKHYMGIPNIQKSLGFQAGDSNIN